MGRVKVGKIMSGLHTGVATHPSSAVVLPMSAACRMMVKRNFGLGMG